MSVAIVLKCVGFETPGAVREYALTRQGSGGKSSEYAHAAFVAHRLHCQDAPDICSLRLRREFAIRCDHLPSAHFSITDAELADYMEAQTLKTKPAASACRGDKES